MIKLIKLLSFLLIFPIRIWIGFINLIRNMAGSAGSGRFVSEFRTLLQNDFSKSLERAYLKKILPDSGIKLTYLDIGARDGLPVIVELNRGSFGTIILCEGEKEEAVKLRSQGYLVIDKFLSDKPGEATFYFIKEHPGASSLWRPGTAFLHFFSRDHYQLYNRYSEERVVTSTLNIELEKLGVKNIDFMKMDVQGSELAILKGLNTVAPLFIEVEVLPLPTYQGAPYGTFITAELVRRGYICFRQSERMCRDGIYIYSNELYMPDYTTETGKQLIIANLEKWRFLMRMFDVNALADHIEAVLNKKLPG